MRVCSGVQVKAACEGIQRILIYETSPFLLTGKLPAGSDGQALGSGEAAAAWGWLLAAEGPLLGLGPLRRVAQGWPLDVGAQQRALLCVGVVSQVMGAPDARNSTGLGVSTEFMFRALPLWTPGLLCCHHVLHLKAGRRLCVAAVLFTPSPPPARCCCTIWHGSWPARPWPPKLPC